MKMRMLVMVAIVVGCIGLPAQAAKKLKPETDTPPKTKPSGKAAAAETLMAKLDAVGVTKEQKDRIAPVIRDANKKVKAEVDKSETRSPKDKKSRDKIVASYKEARKKLRQKLTPEQREKLTKKLAEEA